MVKARERRTDVEHIAAEHVVGGVELAAKLGNLGHVVVAVELLVEL